jgi:putative ABC transport system substrate-binding protein
VQWNPCSLLLLAALSAPAAAQDKPSTRIGVFFWHDSPNDEATFAGIRDGLESKGIRFEILERRADSDPAKADKALAELHAARCDLILAMGTRAALLASTALQDVPVVYAAVSNPVASRVVEHWQGSGRQLAGGTNRIPPATIQRVFAMAVPDLRRLGMLRSKSSGVVSEAERATMQQHLDAVAADIQIAEQVAANDGDIPRAVQALIEADVDAIWIPIDFTVYTNLKKVRQITDTARVPLVSTAHNGARDGAIVTVTVDFAVHGRRIAALCARILNGAKPKDLPVDTMQSYAVVANLEAARRIGHELPIALLVRADTLIDPAAEKQDVGR